MRTPSFCKQKTQVHGVPRNRIIKQCGQLSLALLTFDHRRRIPSRLLAPNLTPKLIECAPEEMGVVIHFLPHGRNQTLRIIITAPNIENPERPRTG